MTYWCIAAGQHPFGARNDPDYISRLQSGDVREHEPIDSSLFAILHRALRRDPWSRPTMLELAALLKSWLEEHYALRRFRAIAVCNPAVSRSEPTSVREAIVRAVGAMEASYNIDSWNTTPGLIDLDAPTRAPFSLEACSAFFGGLHQNVDAAGSAALVIAHVADAHNVSFDSVIEMIEEAGDNWKVFATPEMIPEAFRSIIPDMHKHFQVLLSADGRISYEPSSTEGEPRDGLPRTKRLPPDLVDTERLY